MPALADWSFVSLPLNVPVLPMNPMRKSCSHNIVAKGYANDDESDISGPKANGKIGIQSKLSAKPQSAAIVLTHHTDIARSAITGRGVLLDWRRWALDNGIRYSPFESHAIPLEQLQAVAIEQNVTFRTGDILLVRSGWTEEYRKLGERDKIALARRKDRRFVGVEASREMIKWHWDNGFAAVAGDTNAYEVWPPTKPDGVALHEVFLSGWGMPIGEVWDLEALAACCNQLKRWTFFLSSTPLNLEGGVASPANAVAIS
ncbi:hypothetical protein SLS58_007829 [Diplodia intermedia]|uniref:Cyclase n=1 Tax=Diplodia intermedia TaxID=856260 RepID=A0ABR3TJK5_9PEZI